LFFREQERPRGLYRNVIEKQPRRLQVKKQNSELTTREKKREE
jgi:hypothetical protein